MVSTNAIIQYKYIEYVQTGDTVKLRWFGNGYDWYLFSNISNSDTIRFEYTDYGSGTPNYDRKMESGRKGQIFKQWKTEINGYVKNCGEIQQPNQSILNQKIGIILEMAQKIPEKTVEQRALFKFILGREDVIVNREIFPSFPDVLRQLTRGKTEIELSGINGQYFEDFIHVCYNDDFVERMSVDNKREVIKIIYKFSLKCVVLPLKLKEFMDFDEKCQGLLNHLEAIERERKEDYTLNFGNKGSIKTSRMLLANNTYEYRVNNSCNFFDTDDEDDEIMLESSEYDGYKMLIEVLEIRANEYSVASLVHLLDLSESIKCPYTIDFVEFRLMDLVRQLQIGTDELDKIERIVINHPNQLFSLDEMITAKYYFNSSENGTKQLRRSRGTVEYFGGSYPSSRFGQFLFSVYKKCRYVCERLSF